MVLEQKGLQLLEGLLVLSHVLLSHVLERLLHIPILQLHIESTISLKAKNNDQQAAISPPSK